MNQALYEFKSARGVRALSIASAAFAVPALFAYGNEKRNDLVGPSFKNVDFNVSKNFPSFESTQLQFRAEMFNLPNHTNYSTPVSSVGDSGLARSQVLPGSVGRCSSH